MNKDVKIGLAIGLLLLVVLFVWLAWRSSQDTTTEVAEGERPGTPAETRGTGGVPPQPKPVSKKDDTTDVGEVEIKGLDPGTKKTTDIKEVFDPGSLTEDARGFDPGTTHKVDDAKPGPVVRELEPELEPEPIVSTPTSYIVKDGDVLSAISEKIYGSSKHWALIAQANNITDPATEVRAGMVLKIPARPADAIPVPPVDTSLAAGERRHTVVKDDTLSEISDKYYGSSRYWRLIAKANNLAEGDILREGSVLVLPKLETTPAPAPMPAPLGIGEQAYVVQKGDTLQAISEKFYGSVRYHRLIQDANRIPDPTMLREGQKLVIPAKPSATPGAEPGPAEPRLDPGERRYVVQQSETLSEIAERELGSREYYRAIMTRNQITDPRLVREGQVLILPSRSALRVLSSTTRED